MPLVWLAGNTGRIKRRIDATIRGAGPARKAQLSGTVPLYRQYDALPDDTIHTIDLSEALYAAANYNDSHPC